MGGRSLRGVRHAVRGGRRAGLLDAGEPVDLIVSRAARLTVLDETGRPFRDAHWATTSPPGWTAT